MQALLGKHDIPEEALEGMSEAGQQMLAQQVQEMSALRAETQRLRQLASSHGMGSQDAEQQQQEQRRYMHDQMSHGAPRAG